LKNISAATFTALALSGCDMKVIDEFLQQNFRTLSKKEKDSIVKALDSKYKKIYTNRKSCINCLHFCYIFSCFSFG